MWDAYTFYRNMKEDGIIFSFTGPTSQSIADADEDRNFITIKAVI